MTLPDDLRRIALGAEQILEADDADRIDDAANRIEEQDRRIEELTRGLTITTRKLSEVRKAIWHPDPAPPWDWRAEDGAS